MHIEFKHEDFGKRGLFLVYVDGVEAGEMSYVHAGPHKIIIDHTGVMPAFEGQDIGKALVMEGARYARENDLKVVPSCPFARAMFNRIDSIKDLLV